VKTCVASKYVLNGKTPPAFARRFPPVNETDSGWCLMSGHADEDADGFGDDPANWERHALPVMTALFPALGEIWDAQVETELEWDESKGAYRLAYSA
jgi:hypothetical protein